MTNKKINHKHFFIISPCICYLFSLLIWFLPGSYSYMYLDGSRTELWVTSLFDFFPTPAVLPLILVGASLLSLTRGHVSRGILWTVLITATLLSVYLGFIGAICLPHFHGETCIWAQALPFPLTVIGTICFVFAFHIQANDT